MPTLPKSLFWRRLDTAGADHVVLADAHGLQARGVAVAASPVPYTCRYELVTDEAWTSNRLEVIAEGGGWLRSIRLERAAGRWRASTAEQGDLDRALTAAGHPRAGLPGTDEPERFDAALDVDLGEAPLFNTLPIRRLRLRAAKSGSEHVVTVAWVRVPSLELVAAQHIYTGIDATRVRFDSAGFSAELQLDADGYVTHYPGLADRP